MQETEYLDFKCPVCGHEFYDIKPRWAQFFPRLLANRLVYCSNCNNLNFVKNMLKKKG